jgi:pyruvate dehydrogenase E1 component beta subunit
VVELAGTGRLPAALEVLAEAGALAAAGEFAVPLVVRVPYGSEAGGLDAPVGAFLCDLPGVRVVCPSTPALAAGLARWAIDARSPVVLLEPRALAHVRGEIGDEAIPPVAGLVRRGTHATIATFGAGVQAAVDAAAALALEGIDVDVIDLVSLAPLDLGMLGARVRATGRLVVAHPGDRALAARIREAAVDAAFLYLEAPLTDARAEAKPITEAVRQAVHY